jgi:hypothetical protein
VLSHNYPLQPYQAGNRARRLVDGRIGVLKGLEGVEIERRLGRRRVVVEDLELGHRALRWLLTMNTSAILEGCGDLLTEALPEPDCIDRDGGDHDQHVHHS